MKAMSIPLCPGQAGEPWGTSSALYYPSADTVFQKEKVQGIQLPHTKPELSSPSLQVSMKWADSTS